MILTLAGLPTALTSDTGLSISTESCPWPDWGSEG